MGQCMASEPLTRRSGLAGVMMNSGISCTPITGSAKPRHPLLGEFTPSGTLGDPPHVGLVLRGIMKRAGLAVGARSDGTGTVTDIGDRAVDNAIGRNRGVDQRPRVVGLTDIGREGSPLRACRAQFTGRVRRLLCLAG